MGTLFFMFGSLTPTCLIVFPNPEPCGRNCPLIDLETPSLLHQDLAALGKKGYHLSTEWHQVEGCVGLSPSGSVGLLLVGVLCHIRQYR